MTHFVLSSPTLSDAPTAVPIQSALTVTMYEPELRTPGLGAPSLGPSSV